MSFTRQILSTEALYRFSLKRTHRILAPILLLLLFTNTATPQKRILTKCFLSLLDQNLGHVTAEGSMYATIFTGLQNCQLAARGYI